MSAVTRRGALKRLLGLGAGAVALAACGATPTPQVVEKIVTSVVEKEVTKIVEGTPQVVLETVVVEKVVKETVVVEETQVVEKEVTVQVNQPEITVTMMQWGESMGIVQDINERVFARFREKHPNIKPVLEAAPWTEFWTKLQTLAAAGDMPDIYSQSIAYGWDHADKRIAMDLQPLLERDVNLDDYFMEIETSGLSR